LGRSATEKTKWPLCEAYFFLHNYVKCCLLCKVLLRLVLVIVSRIFNTPDALNLGFYVVKSKVFLRHSSQRLEQAHDTKVKVKQCHYGPGQALRVPGSEAPRFRDNRHMKAVRLSALRTGRLYFKEIFLVLISVRGRVDSRDIMRPEGLCK
jgi:hypothetical protein